MFRIAQVMLLQLCIRMTCFYFLICGEVHDYCMFNLLLHPVCFVLLSDAAATMYSYDMLLFLDLWWGA
jgi:hypothetical protein